MNRLLHFFSFCVLGVGFFAAAEAQTIVTFDVPGAGTGANQGTVASGINTPGAIIGSYIGSSYMSHGFMLAKNVVITTFVAPGAGRGGGGSGCFLAATCQGTYPQNINPRGDIDGEYVDVSGVNHGFMHPNHGTNTSFDAPGAGTGSFQGTIPLVNNAANAITGYYFDAAGAVHGFLRTEHCHEKGEEEDCEAGDSETIPSPDSALQVDALISARDGAEIAAGLGLTSDTTANTQSCLALPPCSSAHTVGSLCTGGSCFKRISALFKAFDCYCGGLLPSPYTLRHGGGRHEIQIFQFASGRFASRSDFSRISYDVVRKRSERER